MKNSDSPAMPTITYDHGAAMQGLAASVTDAPGLTKREMMAMHMMAARISIPGAPDDEFDAKRAVASTDALLAYLEKSQ